MNMDNSGDHDSKLSALMDMFPTVSRSTLQVRLLENNNDLELTVGLLLKESDERCTVDDELHQLYDMFPQLDCNIIKNQFITNGKSVEPTISDLLNYEILQKLEDNQKDSPNSTQQEEKKNNWKLTKDHTETIIKFTDAPKNVAQKYFVENGFDPIRAIIKIILEYFDKSHFKGNPHIVKQKPRMTALVRGGRVQSSMGLAHLSKKSEMSTKEEEEKTKRAQTYKHSQNSAQMIELNELIAGNHDLKAINHGFLQKCLQFYDGDITKVLDLSTLLIEDEKNITKTWNFDEGFTMTSQDNCKQHLSRSSTPPAPHKNGANNLPKSHFQNEEVHKEATSIMNNLFQTYRLDFHGFLPSEALSILKLALNKWWSKEVTERELNSHNINAYGSKVQFVSPLVVVTGRGIHSVGGISKVRLQVKNFLEKNHYIFWEEPSFFRIDGKKRK
ncbi:cue2p [Saccharomyces arboricola H-6]|uniref:Cue2p n=1 Tax=Saccharomyces arboricola (strain H-6 / AS 2.3317 / CBS 10644) TaxID=1160507 RepID=J8Q5T5_SACAR|nr:cue2p [Saccharomyces arboricola H-6]